MMFKKIVFSAIFVSISTLANAQFVSPEAEERARGPYASSPNSSNVEESLVRAAENAGPRPYTPKTSYKVALVVNREMVTEQDINNRVKAFSFNTRIPLNSETIGMIRERVIQGTIDEKIKIQEATKEGINISDREINDAIKNYARTNKTTPENFYKSLKSNGVDLDTFREQMKSDLSWVRLINKKTSGDIDANQREINKYLEQLKKDAGIERYMISEIVISKKTAKNLNDLVSNLRNDPRFALYAMQFSEAASASRGGSLGWVNKNKLYPQIQKTVQNMRDGAISDPILVGDSYYIIKLEKKYEPGKDKMTIPTDAEVKSLIEGKRLEDFAATYLNKLRQKSLIEIKK